MRGYGVEVGAAAASWAAMTACTGPKWNQCRTGLRSRAVRGTESEPFTTSRWQAGVSWTTTLPGVRPS